ncbi:hypothetical protein A0O34_05205 [Chryseobacterium glaciei]|uniref:DUF6443 domain-containing protein n=1 Tax=Chryseobacterium glaciei TaxID=1685010 RepID=A0A172XSV3_9FLAO|nr:DUF6443 domain-containing protein [Chryseobacterium glaciei]ANF49960.1 hypothetical protein A0O34_05205 [Chryseobacterium glaciei]
MKKILLITNFLLVGFTYAQSGLSTTENYVYEKNCLTEDCSKKVENVKYFDGLGRLKQNISLKATPAGKDIALPVEYDSYGRQIKEYLAIPQTGTQDGAMYPDPLSNAIAVYGNEKIYTEKTFEASPLDKVLQQKQLGNAWSAHPVNFSYSANTANEVKKYTVETTWQEGRTNSELSISGNYLANSLFKSTVIDEDGNSSIEFKNKKGQTVLIRKKDGTQNVDTYYVYNEYNQLAYTIPPLASQPGLVDDTTLNNLCYQYRYDGWNRAVEKKLPGKGWEYMLYDKQNRLVGSQDTVLKAKGQWIYTKYDQFGRVAISGISTGYDRSVEQAEIDGLGANNVNRLTTAPFNRQGVDVYYGNQDITYPNSTKWVTLLSLNYYDTYPPYSFNPSFPPNALTDNSTGNNTSTKSLSVMSLIKNIEDDNWTKNYNYYDAKGRVLETYSINHLGGYTKTDLTVDFAGVPQKTEMYHVRKQGEVGVTIKERFDYDLQNRLLKHWHQVGSKPEQLLVENSYNELSQLTNKKVGNNLQSIDYAYNIRGLVTDVNKNQMGLADLGGKLFSYRIKYNQKEGITNPDSGLFPDKNVIPKYNGNITEVDWRAVETIGSNPSFTPKRYGYAYDGLNRVTAGYYQNPNNPYSKENTESIDYDLNGNISKLYRTAILEGGTNTATVIDRLSYSYIGNQITNINDASQNSTGYEGGGNMISYDVNGNMTTMPDKSISSIKYNYLNLPNYLHVNKNSIEDVTINTKYRADGTKLTKENTTVLIGVAGPTTTKRTTDYLDGFQYFKLENINGGGSSEMLMSNSLSIKAMQPQIFSLDGPVVTDPTIDPPFGGGGIIVDVKTEDLQFFPTSEGFYDYQKDQYIYQYKDHLGNVRISFARNSTGALEITDKNDYYPFGMNHLKTGTAFFGLGIYQNYKYNDKELQETGMYSYGWRDYMPDIGRWNGIDQLAEKYLSTSTYAYVANNPISLSDVDGRWFDQDGHIINTSGQTMEIVRKKLLNNFVGRDADEGGGGDIINFNNAAAFGLLQDILTKDGGIGAMFSLVEQLKKAGFNDPAKDKAKYTDKDILLEKIPALNDLFRMVDPSFSEDPTINSPGLTRGTNISLNMNNISNVLHYVFTLGHEMNHVFANRFFKDSFNQITHTSSNSTRGFNFFQETMGLGWEMQMGSTKWCGFSGLEAASYYYNIKNLGSGYDQTVIDRVSGYWNQLKSEWNSIYNQKLKQLNK